MNSYIHFFFLSLLLISPSLNLMVILDSVPFCITKFIPRTDTLKLSFQLSSEDSEMETIMKGFNNETIYSSQLQKDSFEFFTIRDFTYELCFYLRTGGQSIVSFDFTSYKEQQYNLVKEEELDLMYRNITTISVLFEEIEQNLKYDIEKRDSHYKNTNDFFGLINKLSISKILGIIILSGFEIYLLKRILSQTKASFSDIFQNPFSIHKL